MEEFRDMNDKLYVCTVYDNPLFYKARYKNYKNFSSRVNNNPSRVELYTAEIALGENKFWVTSESDGRSLRLRTNSELWHKENALNELFKILPPDARNIAWMDADVAPANPYWVEETIQQLETYDVVQMFSHTMDLGPSNQPIDKPYPGYMYQYVQDGRHWEDPAKRKKQTNCIPGLAWAVRKETLNKLGMLIDWAIVGGADYHMASALIDSIESSIPEGMNTLPYSEKCFNWARKATGITVGYVPGLLLHHWHGDRKNRNYKDRWDILINNRYDPGNDLKRNWQGLYEFVTHPGPGGNRLRNQVRDYMRSRNDDETGEIIIP